MLPLGDDNSDRRRWPIVTALLVIANFAVFLYELNLQNDPIAFRRFIRAHAVVPLAFSQHQARWDSLVTSMFLHGSWLHLLGNMLYLWIFGDNVEDRLGRIAFVAFYLLTGVAGSFLQILADPTSPLPQIGASGAISGVLGAYIVMFPRKRVRVLFFIALINVPAYVVLGLWFLTQAFAGAGSLGANAAQGGVAYLAHVGGFVAGVIGAGAWKAFSSAGGTRAA